MTANTTTAATDSTFNSGSALLTLMKLRTFIALFAVFIFFSFAAPNFLSAANLILMSKHVALNAFLAMGMTFVIITGGIDLSVGSIVGLCGMVAGGLLIYGIDLGIGYTIYFNIIEISLITLAVGVAVGFINGLLITKLNVAPFIATLGTLYVARGLALLSSDGQTFPNLVGREDLGTTGFAFLGSGSILGLPVSIWILIVVALAAAYIARYTPLGRQIFAVGGNERAARMSGIRVDRVKMFVYHLVRTDVVASGNRQLVRTERHCRSRPRRDFNVGRTRHHWRHNHRCIRHRYSLRRSGHDGRFVLLADGHQRACHHHCRGG